MKLFLLSAVDSLYWLLPWREEAARRIMVMNVLWTKTVHRIGREPVARFLREGRYAWIIHGIHCPHPMPSKFPKKQPACNGRLVVWPQNIWKSLRSKEVQTPSTIYQFISVKNEFWFQAGLMRILWEQTLQNPDLHPPARNIRFVVKYDLSTSAAWAEFH